MYLNKFKLDGKVAVITGAARGIGFCTADALSEAGAEVILTDLNAEATEASAQKLRDKGRKASAFALDVTDSKAVEATAQKIIKAHGQVDILVNNAGIALSFVPAEVMDDFTWNKVMDVNLNGVFWCCRSFGKHMLERKQGAIVNLGSMSADIVNYPQEQAQYNASKAGVHHLTRSLAAEWAERGVRVNAVAPTYIETEMTKGVHERPPEVLKEWVDSTPMARMGKPEEIASVILFLASDAASLMTGACVAVDGGYTLW
ncbi:SDR family NAD(P)-dependent oxidoreductase [Aestuariivirga litoralis]|uniref:SDR family NAD(P)-dependent oxidoreductase n=1 Tax=Aestuariivirga litoralis TaxID=2650924 RepID=UPI0018C6ED8E|nr:glucose 1-dehydrogenase [Aestuariivirga litoralis]MBG1231457.1 SDR family oxidoreductase [Aestuariivirga litoralis]